MKKNLTGVTYTVCINIIIIHLGILSFHINSSITILPRLFISRGSIVFISKPVVLTAGQTRLGLSKAWYGNYNNQVKEFGGSSRPYFKSIENLSNKTVTISSLPTADSAYYLANITSTNISTLTGLLGIAIKLTSFTITSTSTSTSAKRYMYLFGLCYIGIVSPGKGTATTTISNKYLFGINNTIYGFRTADSFGGWGDTSYGATCGNIANGLVFYNGYSGPGAITNVTVKITANIYGLFI